MPLIFLIGMPGAGKTYTGERLAHLLALPFIDTDAEVEKRAGMPIYDLWYSQGEEAFRALELEVLADTLLESPAIVATGGGLGANPDALAQMLAAGLVIWLNTDRTTALERLEKQAARPLFEGAEPHEKYNDLLEDRTFFYSQAHVTVQGGPRLLATLAQLAAMATLP